MQVVDSAAKGADQTAATAMQQRLRQLPVVVYRARADNQFRPVSASELAIAIRRRLRVTGTPSAAVPVRAGRSGDAAHRPARGRRPAQVPADAITLDAPIGTYGVHHARVRLDGDAEGRVTVYVVKRKRKPTRRQVRESLWVPLPKAKGASGSAVAAEADGAAA